MQCEKWAPPRSEPVARGQALIIIAFSMVVLLGIGAIVVDLGLSWMLRRQEQNAADPGAIAAARYIEDADYGSMVTAACFYAKENGFFQGDDSSCSAATDANELEVLWPPSGPHAGQFAGRPEMVLVVISNQHPSFFGRIFGQDVATVATGAVAAKETTSANSNSLVALDPHSCAAGHVHGNGTVVIEPVENPETPGVPYSGGYVHINSDCGGPPYNDSCGSGDGALKKSGNAGSLLDAPHVYVHGTCQVSGGTMNSPVTEGAPQIGDPLASLVGPRQELYPAGQCPLPSGTYVPLTPSSNGCTVNHNTVTLTPGVYWGGWNFKGTGTVVKLEPGIYIIAGGGISQAGSSTIDTVGDGLGNPARVLIFSTDNTMDPACADDIAIARSEGTGYEARCVQGPIKMAGQSNMLLAGLDSGPWRGLLMWQDGAGSNPTAPIELVGQGDLSISGTIYAPKAHVKLEGNGDETGIAAVQIISWTWQIGGNGDLYMPYDPTELYRITQRGLVH